MINIDNYKFYVRDVGITDSSLNTVLQDVINDIALSTKIFKKAFGFTIEPDLYDYNFGALLEIYERTQEQTIDNLTINSYTEDQLLQFLSDPTQLDITVADSSTNGIPLNTYIETLDILSKTYNTEQSSLGSVFDYFEPIDSYSYKLTKKLQEPVRAIAILSIIPNIENIDDRAEKYLRTTIIEGLRYFVNTQDNAQNINPDINNYKKYERTKLELQNKFPVYVGQQIKRSPVWQLAKYMIF